MNGNNFEIQTVEELLRRSKQMQNKIRQELNLQEIESAIHTELKKQKQSPPEWDNVMPSAHVNSIVADHLQDESNLSIKSDKKAPNKGPGEKANKQEMPHKSNNRLEVRDSLLSLHRTSASARTGVAEKSSKKFTTPIAPKRKTTSILNASPSSTSKINVKSNKLVATSSYRLPLQRFAEPTNKSIDFFKEHPDLELDMTSEQTSLFPRRFQRSSEYLPHNGSCVNVVEAEVKLPHATPVVVQPDTWNGILMQNKPAHKIVRLKKNKEVVLESTLNCVNSAPPAPKIKESDQSYDIISAIPAKGIFTIEEQSDRLAKQKKCHLQRFPVLYMRPKCKVQKAASISIRGESILKEKTGENSTGNVKYFEYKHRDEGEDGDKIVDLEFIPDRVGIDDKEKDDSNETNKIKENKFFKALEFVNLTDYSTTNSASSPFTRQSSSSNRSLSSLSSSSSLKNVRPSKTVNEIHHNLRSPFENVLSTTIITKESVMSPPSRREAHVQTDIEYKETVSTNTSPLPSAVQTPPQPDITASVKINDTINNMAQLHKVENSVEEDIIAKIFERIRNDLPDALEVYKNRNTSTAIGITTPMPTYSSDKENQEKKNQKHENQTSNSNNPSNVKLSSNEIAPRLRSLEEKRQVKDNHSQTISEMIPIDCYPDSPTPVSGAHREVLLQQNPLLVQTINQNKSSAFRDAMLDVERMKQGGDEYPTGAEIQRAVKIFIDSLTLNGFGGEKKVNINDISTKRRSIALVKSELVTRDSLNKYTSSDSSSTSNSINNTKIVRNMKRMRQNEVGCDNFGSSISTSLSSSDLESESDDATIDMQSLSLHSIDKNNTSDGEIKSIGEI